MNRRRTLAQQADKYVCYQQSVQAPDIDVAFLQRVFKRTRGRPARSLREDFAGTSAFSCEWVRSHRENTAFAVDLDPEPLDWGRKHNVAKLTPEQQSRVKLVEGDVRHVGHEPVDVTVAYNFSYFLFPTRDALREYFRAAHATLESEGLLFLDAYGGGQAMESLTEETELDDFTYVWEQRSFDPISHWGENHIHFTFPDGSEIRRAFSYSWRVWTIPEVRELLAEVGFSDSHVYWEGTDRKTGEGNDVFTRREKAKGDPAWVAHIVALP